MSDILLQALLGASKRDAERDPFLAGARGIEQVDSSQYDMSPGQRILAGVLSGLGGGVSRGIGESRVKDKYNTRSNNLMEGMRSGKLMEALAADEELSSIAPLYAIQEEQNKVGRLQELNKALLPKGYMMKSFDGKPEQVFDPIADDVRKAREIKRAELMETRNSYGAPGMQGTGTSEAAPLGMFGDYENTNAKRNQLMREGMSQGLTPNGALEYADKNLAAATAMSKEAVKKIESSRRRADKLKELASVAEAGVQGAGETGGTAWGLRDFISKAYAQVDPEERQQRASQALLESIEPDIIAASRPVGVGAMSDREMKSYLSAGPSSAKAPDENRKLIEKMKNVAAIEQEYGDFLEAYIEDKGDAIGADKAWQSYKEAHPLIVQDGSGEFVFNSNRQPWTDFFSQKRQQVSEPSVQGGGEIQTRMIGGQPVRVRRLPDGRYEEVE